MSGSSHQGVYAPLPQSVSDSDSDDHIVINNAMLNDHSPNSRRVQKLINLYYPLDYPSNATTTQNATTPANEPTVVIQGCQEPEDAIKQLPMSRTRKCLFVGSIALCFVAVIVFVWVLPCNKDYATVVDVNHYQALSWERTYHDMEIKSTINVVPGSLGANSRHLIFLYRSDVINEYNKNNYNQYYSNDNYMKETRLDDGGVLCIHSKTGDVVWILERKIAPFDLDCTLSDLNGDNVEDCLLIGGESLLEVVNSAAGDVIWKFENKNVQGDILCDAIDLFPLVIVDVNDDGVADVLIWCHNTNDQFSNIVLLSGKTGELLGDSISNICLASGAVVRNRTVSYKCRHDDQEIIEVDLAQLLQRILGVKRKEIERIFARGDRELRQHVVRNDWLYGKVGDVHAMPDKQRNVYTVNNRKLVVQNDGHCPHMCNVTVQLFDQQTGRDNLTWSHLSHNMYGMVPALLQFNNTKRNRDALKGHTSGFILKFWQWSNHQHQHDKYYHITSHRKRRATTRFDAITRPAFRRATRDAGNLYFTRRRDNVTVHFLTERVVLITFNATDIHIVNASQNEIIQLCWSNVVKKARVQVCQPDLTNQDNSVLIADLDGDGSQELISYLSTFVTVDTNRYESNFVTGTFKPADAAYEKSWHLQSVVKMVKLEAELPKLYEAVSKY